MFSPNTRKYGHFSRSDFTSLMTVPAMISFLLVRGLYASHKTFPQEIIELKKQKQKQKQTNKKTTTRITKTQKDKKQIKKHP